MMTNGPAATVGEILEWKLPRPRDRLKLADIVYHHTARRWWSSSIRNKGRRRGPGDGPLRLPAVQKIQQRKNSA